MSHAIRLRRIAISIFTLAALGASPAAASQAPATPDLLGNSVLAEAESEDASTAGGVVKINRIEQSNNGVTSLTWTLHNQGTETIALAESVVGRTYLYNGEPFSGVTLHDASANVRYHPLMDDDGACLCTGGTGRPPELATVVGGTSYATYWATYQLPEDVDAVTVEIPGFEPIEDVPVG